MAFRGDPPLYVKRTSTHTRTHARTHAREFLRQKLFAVIECMKEEKWMLD